MALDLFRDLRLRGRILNALGAAGNDQVLGVDASGLLTFLNLGNFPLDFKFARRITSETVTGGFTEYLTLDSADVGVGNFEGGTYIVLYSFVNSTSGFGTEHDIQVQLDDTTNIIDPNDSGQLSHNLLSNNDRRYVSTGIDVISITPGAHFIDIDHSNPGGGSGIIYQALLACWKVAN